MCAETCPNSAYSAENTWLVQCNGEPPSCSGDNSDYRQIRHMTSPAQAEDCPEYYAIGDGRIRYATIEEAAEATNCSTECVWASSLGGSALCAGVPFGWEQYSTRTEGCSPQIYTCALCGIYCTLEDLYRGEMCAE